MARSSSRTTMRDTGHTHGVQEDHCACKKNWCPICRAPICAPVRDTQWTDDALKTSYQRDYDKKRGLRREPRQQELLPSRPFSGVTTQRADYTPKASSPFVRAPEGPMPRLPFIAGTTYDYFHDRKQGVPSTPLDRSIPDYHVPFVGSTTQRDDYVPKGPGARPFSAPVAPWPHRPFDGSTTYTDDFVRKPLPHRLKRSQPLLPSRNTAGSTTYGTDFTDHPLRPSDVICCDHPDHPRQHWHAQAGSLRPGKLYVGSASGLLYRG
ncbi:flagellar associated protein [Haematococcus lacustris]